MRLAFTLAFALLGCASEMPPPPDCGAACERIERMGCIGWRGWFLGTQDDVPCEVGCRGMEAHGQPTHAGCVASADSCRSAQTCFVPVM